MTSEELQNQLSETWGRSQSVDDSHEAIWGEPFAGETVRILDIAAIIDKPDYTNPEGMVRRLREILQANAEVRHGRTAPARHPIKLSNQMETPTQTAPPVALDRLVVTLPKAQASLRES